MFLSFLAGSKVKRIIGRTVEEARARGWEEPVNGDLIEAAEQVGHIYRRAAFKGG
jgi:hypothetical protein